jgi:nucleoside-diphosphate-sugar epimerase
MTELDQLEARLSEPTDAVIAALAKIDGDVLVLGVSGKMGPSLARMARRALDAAGSRRRVIGVARFSSKDLRRSLQEHGVETIECDLLDESAVAALPDVANVVFMAGMKFGSSGQEPLTWAMNTHLPSIICRRYPKSRILVFSTGNVYGLTPVNRGGSLEGDSLRPDGEYAMSCVGRERIFQYFSTRDGIPVAILRINYASELRYGVLLDLAQKVWRGQPVDLAMGHFNTIWLRDANAMALQAFQHVSSPPSIFNITGKEIHNVRDVCQEFGRLLEKTPVFTGKPAETALLSNPAKAYVLFGEPKTQAQQMIEWVAQWVQSDQPVLDKPTHFESRDGRF